MSAATPATDALTSPTRTEYRCLSVLLVLAALLRIGVICWKPDSLSEDRDLYWGIAQRLAAGHGFANPDWGYPTAYRPPLYPLLLAGIIFVGGGTKLLAAVQIGMGVATVWLTWRLAWKLELKSYALLVATFVAFNPLLIQSTALAMTETCCALLLVAMLLGWMKPHGQMWFRERSIGVFAGLAVLCRPTVGAFVVLASAASVAWWWSTSPGTRRPFIEVSRQWRPIIVAFCVTIAPWAIRNAFVFGQPIVATTHGGYTLLLGNNEEAYRAEIAQPTGHPWDSREWQESLRLEGRRAGIDPFNELAVDRWMTRRAWDWIASHPLEFVQACWLRVRRFWNIFPGGADAGSLPKIAQWGMAVFFAIELLATAFGLWRLRRDEWSKWWPLVLLVLSFALVHVVYWSNLRMRAPVEPVIALLAARGLARWPSSVESGQSRGTVGAT